jgi:Na+/H+ antiporter NhaD/arsenite permease-like protein
MNGETTLWLTAGLFTLTYLALAFGRVPGLRIDRAGIALVGATLMLVTGMLSFRQAISPDAIDYKTLTLLFGMMVVVGFLRLSGLLQRVTELVFDRIRTPRWLLAVTITISGVLSAFLINDIVCLALTPLVLHLARRLRFDPVPHLIALATAANIGSTGTITGNPQNIYIGSHSGIPYLRFAARLGPVAALGLVLNFVVIALVYRRQLTLTTGATRPNPGETLVADRRQSRQSQGRFRVLQGKSAIVALATVTLFFTGLPLELVALGAASVLLLSRIKPEHIYRQIDWSLLVMFIGLFVVVHAFQLHVVDHWGIEHWDGLLSRQPVGLLSLVATFLSNLVSNVPAVLLMEPVLKAIPAASRETAWLALAMSSTLAGNLTVLGSVANLIVLENGHREGVRVSFWEYCKVGVPLTILTLALGIAWLEFVHY